jgi:HSP20 family protein
VVQFDLPGVDMYSVDLDGPRNVLTVRAERRRSTGEDTEMIAAERPRGMLRRQLILGDTPDTDRVHASYTAGVLTLRIPVTEKATPCKITNAVPDADRAALTG